MKKKKKIKTPLPLRIISWAFPKVERFIPWLAERWFVHIFFSTARFPYPIPEKEIMESAEKSNLAYEGKRVQVYQWGSGIPILLMHGWMGRATQFRKFIPFLVDKGYKVLAFDATGHGMSEGKNSHILEFAHGILQLQQIHGPFEFALGHSIGGVSILHAIKQGLKVNKLVMISSPTIADEILTEFRKRIGASERNLPYFDRYIRNKFNVSFDDLEAREIIKTLSGFDLLLIYDHDDREISMENPKALQQNYSSTTLIETYGLGHTRILKDEGVINEVITFVEKEKITA